MTISYFGNDNRFLSWHQLDEGSYLIKIKKKQKKIRYDRNRDNTSLNIRRQKEMLARTLEFKVKEDHVLFRYIVCLAFLKIKTALNVWEAIHYTFCYNLSRDVLSHSF